MIGLAPHSCVALTCPLLFLSLSFSRSGPWALASLHFSVTAPPPGSDPCLASASTSTTVFHLGASGLRQALGSPVNNLPGAHWGPPSCLAVQPGL